MTDVEGNSKFFGIAKFESAEDAAKAVDGLNGQKFDDKDGCVEKAQKKGKREQEHLDDTISYEGLNEFFAPFATITFCKVTRDPNGTIKGSGVIAFSISEEASRAQLLLHPDFDDLAQLSQFKTTKPLAKLVEAEMKKRK
ncbi:hypothetical protein LXL04_036000 [Taraxacum kok-saghyz]